MSLITPDFGLLFWMTLIFVIVFFILAKFGFPIVTGMVEKRVERISDSIRLAKEAEEKLSALSEQQAKLVDEARLEQGRILKEAAAARDAMIAKAKEQADAEAAKIIEHAKMEIAAERESALREIRGKVAELSVEVAEKIVRKDLEKTDSQLKLIDRLVEEVSDARMN